MSKPKLALIPSGYKSGKVYSILPNDASGDFDFTRQSIGTRIRKDGLIEEAKTVGSITNELLYSEDYSQSQWSKIRSTISTDQTLAPDGTNTADKIIPTVDNNTHRCDQVITLTNSAVYTLSFYAKEGGYNCIRASIGQTGLTFGSLASFNLNTETVSITGTVRDAQIQSISNDWYRCSITMDAGTSDRIVIGIGNNNSYSFAGNTTSGVFMWGAMLSEGALSDYIKTEGSQVTETVETFTDVPRLDWLNSNCPSLLLEPQRTNLVVKSETLTDTGNATTGWDSATFGSGTISVDSGFISPTGELNAYKFSVGGIATGNNGCLHTHDDYLGTRFINAGDYSISVWLKGEVGGEIVPVDFRSRTSAGETGDEFTLTTEWKRYTVTVNKASASNTTGGFQFRFYNRSDIADQVFYVFGCQIEQAAYSSSYIKADDGSTITRLKDECYINSGIDNIINTDEGTLYFEVETPRVSTSSDFDRVVLSDQTATTDRVIFDNFNGSWRVVLTSSAGTQTASIRSVQANTKIKVAFTYSASQIKVSYDGNDATTTSITYTPATTLESFKFSNAAGNGQFFQGKIHDVRYFDTVLSNVELKELTL